MGRLLYKYCGERVQYSVCSIGGRSKRCMKRSHNTGNGACYEYQINALH